MTELDEIRAILAQTARQQAENARGITELKESLAATQAIADSNARSTQGNSNAIASSNERLTRTEAICDSNARAVEANSNAIAELKESIRFSLERLFVIFGRIARELDDHDTRLNQLEE